MSETIRQRPVTGEELARVKAGDVICTGKNEYLVTREPEWHSPINGFYTPVQVLLDVGLIPVVAVWLHPGAFLDITPMEWPE